MTLTTEYNAFSSTCLPLHIIGLKRAFIDYRTHRGHANNPREMLAMLILTQFLNLHEQILPHYQQRPLRIAQRSSTGDNKQPQTHPITNSDKYLKRCCTVCLKQITWETKFVSTSSLPGSVSHTHGL